MNVEALARFQFALTAGFHYLFPPMTIGVGLLLVFMEAMYLKTKNPLYHSLTHFWVKIFALIFGIGVATGIVLEFEFGTNWSTYSRYVGDIFGSALAAEGVFAFFLESGFLAILVFGWDRVSEKMHFLATCLVALGSMFSAVWIIVANSWMQTPAGYRIATENGVTRARITDFWAMVFNPSTLDRLSHTVTAAWLTGAFFVCSVSAYYLLKQRHLDVAKASMKLGLTLAIIGCLTQLLTGHASVVGVARNQPAKMAAMEGQYDSSKRLDLTLLGWTDPVNAETHGISIPGMGSYLLTGDPNTPVKGLLAIPSDERPPVQPVFQGYHLMILVGSLLILLSVIGGMMWARGTLWNNRFVLTCFVFAVLLPQIANQAGWFTAELGRQPWIVYGMLKTDAGVSKMVQSGQVLASIILFSLIYLLLFALFIYLLNKKIQEGPEEPMRTPKDLGATPKEKELVHA